MASSIFALNLRVLNFVVYCTRNCLITNLSSAVQNPVTAPGNYIFTNTKFSFQKKISSKMESNKRFIVLHRSPINRLLDWLFLTVDDKGRKFLG